MNNKYSPLFLERCYFIVAKVTMKIKVDLFIKINLRKSV